MIKKGSFEKFEKEPLRKEKADIKKKFQSINALYKEADTLGVSPPKTLLRD
jgi:hypothetical protein